MASRLPHEPLPLSVPAGRILVRQGERCPAAWAVETGALAERIVDRSGRSLLLDLAGPGDIVGGLPDAPSPWEVRALLPSRIRALAADPSAPARRAMRSAEFSCDLAYSSVTDRLENRLGDLAARFGRPAPGGVRIGLRLTHDDLASLVGASRESVSRAMSELARRGSIHIEGRGRIAVRTRLELVR